MKNLKLPLLLVLSIFLILLGGFFPKISAAWLDRDSVSRSGYAPVSDVRLEFSDGSRSLDMRSKLALLRDYTDSMELPASLSTLSQDLDTVTSLTVDTIRQYYAAGIIPDMGVLSRNQITAKPYLVSWSKDAGQGNIFWNVGVTLDDAFNRSLFLILDDQTGRVCIFDYTDNDAPLDRANMPDLMQGLCKTYLTGLGQDFSQYNPLVIAQDAHWSDTQEHTLLAYESWSDILYGQVTLNFCVTESKVYVALS